MLMQANSSFYDKDNPITNHKDIVVRYFKSTFLVDLVTLVCLVKGNSNYADNASISCCGLEVVFMLRIFYMRDLI